DLVSVARNRSPPPNVFSYDLSSAMKNWMIPSVAVFGLILGATCTVISAQQEGPAQQGSETVARPKKKSDSSKPADSDPGNLPKIPSKLNQKNKEEQGGD